jgi:ATP-dependent RNA helicase SUPV3L1/SUV3
VDKAKHVSCTVEMADVHQTYDCVVIDEVQLIGDRDRGWAWTRAVLGVAAMEVHLCGSSAFVDIVRRICEETGDYVEVTVSDVE